MDTRKVTAATVEPVPQRCSSCGAILREPRTMMIRESDATRAMAGAPQCALCRIGQYRRMLWEQLSA